MHVKRRLGVNGAERGRGLGPWTVAVSLREDGFEFSKDEEDDVSVGDNSR